MTKSADVCEVWAPAKLNLHLEVLGRRPDGYHELETVLVAISLFDTVRFQTIPQDNLSLQCDATTGHDWLRRPKDVPAPADNLALRAALAIKTAGDVKAGARIWLAKRIPVGSGLGGGSSDAAAVLLAANAAWNVGLVPSDLLRIAADLGSDVPFFLRASAGIYAGRGESHMTDIRLPRLHWVVLAPPIQNSTAAVYQRCQIPAQPRSCEPWKRVSCGVRQTSLRLPLFNRLQAPASELNPQISKACRAMQSCGVRHPMMTGSGSACFGMAANRRHASRIARLLHGRRWGQAFQAVSISTPDARTFFYSSTRSRRSWT